MSNKIGERFRHERKYRISEWEREYMQRRMTGLLSLDAHAGEEGYSIRSLYFDDAFDRAAEEKDAGILMRKKYRVRIYNGDDARIRLERKKKFGEYIYKESAPLTKEEFYRILEGDYGFLLRSPHSLLQEFYVECVSALMRPRVIVDYERIPYVMEAGTVRVTFDRNLRAAVGSFDIFDKTLASIPRMAPGELLLEVKFTEFLPQIVRELIPAGALEQQAFSKYCICYDATRYQRGLENWYDGRWS